MLLGVHVSRVSKVLDNKTSLPIDKAIVRDIDTLGLNCAQIYTYGPRNTKPNKLNIKAIIKATKNINLSVHSSYASVGVWKVNAENKNTKKSKFILSHIYDQLKVCKSIKAYGFILHINRKHADEIAYVMKTFIKSYAKKTKVKILLEMVSSKADDRFTYETPEKIDNLTTLIGPKEKWWGWCVDTAHLWGAGVSVKSYEQMNQWLTSITYKKKILMIHLNGSSAKLHSGQDKHEIPMSHKDIIWNNTKKKNGLYAIVKFALKYKSIIICEINRGKEHETIKSLETIKSIN